MVFLTKDIENLNFIVTIRKCLLDGSIQNFFNRYSYTNYRPFIFYRTVGSDCIRSSIYFLFKSTNLTISSISGEIKKIKRS